MSMRVAIKYAWVGVLFALLWLLGGCSTPEPTIAPSPAATLTPGPLSLTLLYTGDGWGYTEPCACDPSVGGLARRAAYIRTVREARQTVLVVDSGDSLLTLQRVGDHEQGRLLAEAYNQMGYDAMALGGMDFRMGLDVLREQIQVADYAVLSANTLDPQTGDWFDKPYQIFERGGHRIALIGLTDPQIAEGVTDGEVEVSEPVSTLMEVVTQV
jgi:2',3'-cyclic-nucleotide 2'-phosphodiesterase (5'-nucleotidase family)